MFSRKQKVYYSGNLEKQEKRGNILQAFHGASENQPPRDKTLLAISCKRKKETAAVPVFKSTEVPPVKSASVLKAGK